MVIICISSIQKLKAKLYDKRHEFTFPIINFPFISSNIPALPAYEVYISHSYAFLWNVRSTVTYWTKLTCWHNSYINKATLLLCWSHRYKSLSTRSFPFYVDYVFPQSLTILLLNLTIYIDNNSALTWHKIDIRMRLKIGENARVSRAFSPIRAEYVYRILCQVNALLLSLFCNH